MKHLYSLALLGFLASPLAHADCSNASKQIALNFINTYIKTVDSDKWVTTNKQVTTNFKQAYKKLVDDARKLDPEIGLGFDPILDAQDFPDRFDKIKRCDKKTGVMLVSGQWNSSNSDTMEVAVKVIKQQNQHLIEGAGIINIPKAQQAARN